MKIVFWTSVFLVAYPYAIYPVIVAILGTLRPRAVRRAAQQPTLTILIPAFNEVNFIGATIQNKLDQGYPPEKLEIIVVSDGSTDGTDAVVSTFADRGVVLLRREGREGKAAALNDAIRRARGEIVVFSDANSLFGPNALQRMAENFADPEVGYLTGALGFVAKDTNLSGAGAGAYMRYENFVRRIETRAGSIIGVNGGVDAIRRELYVDTPPQLITDFVLPLTVIANGRRVVFDPSVSSLEVPNSEISSEFRMRVRVALRALQGLAFMRRLLDPRRYPLTAFCLLSHKVLRYLGFVFMATALVSNVALAVLGDGYYPTLLALHIAGYTLATVGLVQHLPAWLNRATVIPSYLLLSNAAFAVATFRFLRGDVMAIWQPRAG